MVKTNKLMARASALSSAVVLAVAAVLPVVLPSSASAAALTTRTLDMSSSLGGATGVKHTFSFTVPGAASTVQSMEFEYCDNPVPTVACAQATGASGVDVSSATISGSPTGLTGWSIGTNTASLIQITRTNATNVSSDTAMTITFTGITNPAFDGNSPSGSNSFYVRMRAYTDTAYSSLRDRGSVASATTANIDLTAIVRETLYFCVGTTLGVGTDCTNVSGTAVGLGDSDNVLSLSSATTNRDHSYFRLSTNAYPGSVVKYSASGTLVDGSNNIDAVSSESFFTTPGTSEQFGLAIDTNVAGGNTLCTQAGSPASNGVYAASGYNGGNEAVAAAEYNFDTNSSTTPVTLALSAAPGVVDWATCGVGYAANIAPTTPAGIYTASVNFIAVPTF